MEDNIQEMCERAQKAFEEVEYWPQEKVDEMVAAVGWEWQKEENVKAVAKLAVDEGEIGVYEDKLSKISNKVRGTMWDFKGVKTCGLVREDKKRGIENICQAHGCGCQCSSLHQPRRDSMYYWPESFEDKKRHDLFTPSEDKTMLLPCS